VDAAAETKSTAEAKNSPRKNRYQEGRTPDERLRLQEAAEAEGLDEEIAALRDLLGRVMRERPEDVKLALAAMNTLVRMVVAQYRLSPRASKELGNNLALVLNSFADQLVPSDR
jgi:hypothetical protein